VFVNPLTTNNLLGRTGSSMRPLVSCLLAFQVIVAGCCLGHGQSVKSSNTCWAEVGGEQPDKAPIRIQVAEKDMRRFVILRRAALYPQIARSARIEGAVKIRLVVGTDGVPNDLRVEIGDPQLTQAALDAARVWRYKPSVFNGCPVQVETGITFEFNYATSNPN